jgi:hypothetical protein
MPDPRVVFTLWLLNGEVEEAKNASREVTTLTLSAYLENELRAFLPKAIQPT